MKKSLRILLPILILVSIYVNPSSVTRAQGYASIYVSPTGDDSNPGTLSEPLGTIHKALSLAIPGIHILLLPGKYTEMVRITTGGSPENPLTIRSASSSSDEFAILDGETPPKGGGGACITIDAGASWVVIEDMRFRNCWEDVILLEDASYITVRSVEVEGGRHLVQSENRKNHHILIEESYWEQEERIWTEWGRTVAGWEDLHHGSKYFYNGGIYGGYAAGGLVIRNNVIRHAFNGMQWWNKTTYDNANAEIYGNFFENILDNGVEPEVGAFNLHIYHNRFHNIPLGVLSVDVVHGGDIYFYGNVGWLDDEPLNAWTIYKLGDSTGPLHIYHNSFYYERALGDKGAEPQTWLRHYNNAYYHIEKDMGPKVDWGAHDHEYDYDCSSAPWSIVLLSRGQETHGLENTDPMFVSPLAGDFRLQGASPCVDRGKVIPGFTQGFAGSAPDIGAYEGEALVVGPPFETITPPSGLGYQEKPRITRHRIEGSTLYLTFSWPIVPSSVSPDSVRLYIDGRLANVESLSIGAQDKELIIRTSESLGGKDLRLGFDPLPLGANGEQATLWASTIQPFEGSFPTHSFLDVPPEHPFFAEIEALYQAGYVAGCSADPLMYCPEATMTRAESAVFVQRGVHGAGFLPPDPVSAIFADVPLGEWFAKWANGLWEDGYTAGCGTDPLIYCPVQAHTRTEGTVFFLRMFNGSDYVPPEPTGFFVDVPVDFWGAKWIEAAYDAGLIPACQTEPVLRFCPEDPLDRAMAAYMMVQAKGLLPSHFQSNGLDD